MKVFNYVRFSSPPQEWGQSERRQDDKAVTYCKANDLPLPEKFIDRGVSAWKGKNKEGALGEVVKLLQAGDWLLVEDEDRLSRENPLKLGNYLFEIVNRGVSVVTLTDGQVITAKNFFESNIFLPMILKSTLAHVEDNKKSERILDAWAGRRNKITQGEDAFGKLPFWLHRDRNTGKLETVPEAVEVVKNIFRLSDNGMGCRGISDSLIKAKTPTFRTAKGQPTRWNTSTVQYVLWSPAVYGSFQNYRKIDGKRVAQGDLVDNVLPVIIPKSKVLLIQDKIAKRKHFALRGVDKVRNLFSKLTVCHCGASMIYTHKGKHGYLTCGDFHNSHGCLPGVLNYQVVEKLVFRFIIWAPSQFASLWKQKGESELEQKIESKGAELVEVKRKSQRTARLMIDFEDSEDFRNEYKALQKREKDLIATIEQLESEGRLQQNQPNEWKRLAQEIKEGTATRITLRERFRAIIKSMVFTVQKKQFIIKWVGNRPADTLEVKQVFRGCKPALWYYRFKLGVKGAGFSPWNLLIGQDR